MYDTLKAFGFSSNFIKWIKVLYTDIKSSVIVNNVISEPFSLSRSVRQGCPLSPLLYVLCLEPFAKKVQDDQNIKGIVVPGGQFECKMSLYADDNTTILTDNSSLKHFFAHVNLFQKISGSKINYKKSNGLFIGKWKNRSDHPVGISWVKSCKLLGYMFGYDLNEDDKWSNLLVKFSRTLNYCNINNASYKGKSTILNSLAFSKILYYITAGIIPSHYINIFQRTAFRFLWGSTFEPISRQTLYLPFKEGGLNIPNLKLKWYAILLSHIQKLILGHNAIWVHFAKYWIGLNLRKFNATLADNNFPHCIDFIPPFYKVCLEAFNMLLLLFPDISFIGMPTRIFYTVLINREFQIKCHRLFPQINFSCVLKTYFLR